MEFCCRPRSRSGFWDRGSGIQEPGSRSPDPPAFGTGAGFRIQDADPAPEVQNSRSRTWFGIILHSGSRSQMQDLGPRILESVGTGNQDPESRQGQARIVNPACMRQEAESGILEPRSRILEPEQCIQDAGSSTQDRPPQSGNQAIPPQSGYGIIQFGSTIELRHIVLKYYIVNYSATTSFGNNHVGDVAILSPDIYIYIYIHAQLNPGGRGPTRNDNEGLICHTTCCVCN